MWAEQRWHQWIQQTGQRKAPGVSMLHKELQATEERWEKWFSPGKNTPIGFPVPNNQPLKDSYKQQYMDSTGYIEYMHISKYMYVHKTTNEKKSLWIWRIMERNHMGKFEGRKIENLCDLIIISKMKTKNLAEFH